ncbi:hypothetical protein Avbf_02031 [Armadillidium vulgare]|nr:hypothetical protein Avbf_02031 [Armadillidium vulgare]
MERTRSKIKLFLHKTFIFTYNESLKFIAADVKDSDSSGYSLVSRGLIAPPEFAPEAGAAWPQCGRVNPTTSRFQY